MASSSASAVIDLWDDSSSSALSSETEDHQASAKGSSRRQTKIAPVSNENTKANAAAAPAAPAASATAAAGTSSASFPSRPTLVNPYKKKRAATQQQQHPQRKKAPPSSSSTSTNRAAQQQQPAKKKAKTRQLQPTVSLKRPLEDAFVLEEDLQENCHDTAAVKCASLSSFDNNETIHNNNPPAWQVFLQEQQARRERGERLLLYEDEEFTCLPTSIRGSKGKSSPLSFENSKPPTCRCKGSKSAKLSFNKKERPYYACAGGAAGAAGGGKCNFFQYAMQAEQMHWYRFGAHTGHSLVVAPGGFRAQDLLQGKVGDCWFLSALAVVAERPDLIQRLFLTNDDDPKNNSSSQNSIQDEDGMVQVRLFVDGYWKIVTMDNYLPCLVDDESEEDLQRALQASMGGFHGTGRTLNGTTTNSKPSATTSINKKESSSVYNAYVLADKCQSVLKETAQYLDRHFTKLTGMRRKKSGGRPLQRLVTSEDLAYSKAKLNQLWVPFLEKAYAKIHGSYQAISGGHIAEAFLDLTGAPTHVYDLHSKDFEPRSFWYRLLQYQKQRLPMGCGTSSSAVGIIGMHAYSILDVREIKNVDYKFFQETGVAHGNVSGFTDYDGTVRLLRIRNPHGKGEWQGEFSDRSQIWEKLLLHSAGGSGIVERTMKNDGTFWIDYDNFLLGFSNVDVVLAFLGNHGKSFATNFPAKNSNHRCARAFEVALVEEQPGMPSRDTVEIYAMGIQKTRRGARSGRADRKVSYKVSDLGILVGEGYTKDENGQTRFTNVHGEMFGFNRNGHKRLILDRKAAKSLVVMPVSFGHPAATDKELPFALRFVADAPLIIRELSEVPRLDVAIQKFCLSPMSPFTKQGSHKVLFSDTTCRIFQLDCRGNGGGTVLLYLCVNETELEKQGLQDKGISLTVESTCRGMSCRTEDGLLQHTTLAKGKKFEAAWRQYKNDFLAEKKSRLLLVLYQSGQDTEFGAITVRRLSKLGSKDTKAASERSLDSFLNVQPKDEYTERGIFNPPTGRSCAFNISANLEARNLVAIYQDSHEEQLERALAVSRGDVELQEALELSLRQQGTPQQSRMVMDLDPSFDADLQRALELSKKELSSGGPLNEIFAAGHEDVVLQTGGAVMTSVVDPPKVHASSYEDDLAKAIRLSMAESSMKQKSSSSSNSKVTSTKKNAPMPMVDLTEDDDEQDDKNAVPAASFSGKSEMLLALEGNTTTDQSLHLVGDQKPAAVDLAEKRRLAAEAALKRFRGSS